MTGRTTGAVIGGLAGLLVGAPLAGASAGAEIGDLVGKPATATKAARSTPAPIRGPRRRGQGQDPAIVAGLLVLGVALATR